MLLAHVVTEKKRPEWVSARYDWEIERDDLTDLNKYLNTMTMNKISQSFIKWKMK